MCFNLLLMEVEWRDHSKIKTSLIHFFKTFNLKINFINKYISFERSEITNEKSKRRILLETDSHKFLQRFANFPMGNFKIVINVLKVNEDHYFGGGLLRMIYLWYKIYVNSYPHATKLPYIHDLARVPRNWKNFFWSLNAFLNSEWLKIK